MLYDFIPYTGKGMITELSEEEKEFGVGGQVVIILSKTLPPTVRSTLYFDNFFCSLELIIYLKEHNIDSLGTVRKNRIKGCPLDEDKVMQKRGRGFYDYRNDSKTGLILVKWVDNKVVTLVSSFCGIQPVTSVRRWNNREKKKIDVACPKIVQHYNKHMGEVGLAGMLIELYRLPLKSKRWYLRFGFVVDLCCECLVALTSRKCRRDESKNIQR